MSEKDSFGGINPPAELPPTKYINVKGRQEYEALIKDANKCEELGLDQYYEIMVCLGTWGNWLEEELNKDNHE
jgi:hypothetical protein